MAALNRLILPCLSGPLRWLFRDEFSAAASAPLGSQLPASPGPGSWLVVDTEARLSRSGGSLACAGGKAAPIFGDPGLWAQAVTRRPGLALVARLRFSSLGYFNLGFDAEQTGSAGEAAFYFQGASIYVNCGGASVGPLAEVAAATEYLLAVALRQSGAHFYLKGGAFANWVRLWVSPTGSTAALYPALSNYNTAFTSSLARVVALPMPFQSDGALFHLRLAGSRLAGETFVHPAGFLQEFTVSASPGGLAHLSFRRQDANNRYFLLLTQAGDVQLFELSNGLETLRASGVWSFANGERMVIIVDGSAIRVFAGSTCVLSYNNLALFPTASVAEITSLSGFTLSDLIVWPRTLAGLPAAILDRAGA